METTKSKKEIEIEIRRTEVQKLHALGLSISEIAKKFNLDVRTIGRDIQANRTERIKELVDGSPEEMRKWSRDQLADYMIFVDEIKKLFYEQFNSTKSEHMKIKALISMTQLENQKAEIIKTIIYSMQDIENVICSLKQV